MKRDMSTNENKDYWKFVEKTSQAVSSWPDWKRRLAGQEEDKGESEKKTAKQKSAR